MAAQLTPPRRSVSAALLFLACAALAGVALLPQGVEYRVFGLPEGILALYLAWLLIDRDAWTHPHGITGWLAVAYGTVATAQALHLLLPPPGALQWVVATGTALVLFAALGLRARRRLVATLSILAFLLALLQFAVVPHLWAHLGPAAGTAFGLGDVAEGARRLVVDDRPMRAGGSLVGFAALCAWTLATHLLWPAEVDAATRKAELRDAIREILEE